MSFSSDITIFSEKTRIRLDQVVRKVTVDMTREIVRLTPVDTGLARSSWFFGTQRNPTVGTERVKSGSPSMRRAEQFSGSLRAGGVFFITNNLPYIMALEYGHSKQSPAGMVRITVDRWQPMVNRVVSQVVRG